MRRKITLFALLASALIYACDDAEGVDDGLDGDESVEVSFTAQPTTRVDGVYWDSGDEVGIFAGDDDTNVKYNTSSTSYNLTAALASEAIEYATDTQVSYAAYYPYNIDMVGSIYTLDFSDQSKLLLNDLLWSSVESTESAVDFNLTHQLTKLSVTVESDVTDGVIATIKGSANSADFDVVSGEFSSEVVGDIVLTAPIVESGVATYEALVLPTDDLTGITIEFTLNDATQKITLSEESVATSWAKGDIVVYNLEDADFNIYPNKITIVDKDTITLSYESEQSVDLDATIEPTNSTLKNVKWSSNNTDRATVDPVTGVVTFGAEAGEVVITAEATDAKSETKDEITFTVSAKVIAPTSIEISGETTVVAGSEITLTATVSETATDKSVTWSVAADDAEYAEVTDTANGVIKGLKEGTATIIATANGDNTLTKSVEITVSKLVIYPTSVTITNDSGATNVVVGGSSVTLGATLSDNSPTETDVAWSSSDANVKVEGGVVTANGVASGGTVTITAKVATSATETTENTITLNVIQYPTSISFTEGTSGSKVSGNDPFSLTPQIDPSTATETTITWDSSDKNCATVSTGTVTIVGAGTTDITAEVATISGTTTATYTLTVASAAVYPTAVSINTPSTTDLYIGGESLTLTAALTGDDVTEDTITWTSSDPTNVPVVDGVVIATSSATADDVTITATVNTGASSTTDDTITLNVKSVYATEVNISGDTSVETDSTTTLSASVVSVVESESVDQSVVWSSEDEDVATVDPSTGVVTGVATGSVIIKATTTVALGSDGQAVVGEYTMIVYGPIAVGDYLYADNTYSSIYDATKAELGEIGVVYTINDDGVSGRVISVSESNPTTSYSTGLSWGPAVKFGTNDVANYSTIGLKNMGSIKKYIAGDLTLGQGDSNGDHKTNDAGYTIADFQAFNYCDEFNSDKDDTSYTKYLSYPNDYWYLPGANEMTTFLSLAYGGDDVCDKTTTIYVSLTDAGSFLRAGSSYSYWTSTENNYNGVTAYKGNNSPYATNTGSASKASTETRVVRCLKKFSSPTPVK